MKASLLLIACMASPCHAQSIPPMPYTYTTGAVNNSQTGIPIIQWTNNGTYDGAKLPWTMDAITWNTAAEPFTPFPRASFALTAQAGGLPSGSNSSLAYLDIEATSARGAVNSTLTVERGVQGTRATPHGAFAKTWIAPSRYFWNRNPSGVCSPFVQLTIPVVVVPSGQAFECYGTGDWGTSLFSFSAAQFKWMAHDQGVWSRIAIEQGDWNVVSLPWIQTFFQWSQIAQ